MSCSAVNCSSRSSKKEAGVSFFRFPKDETLRKKWVVALRRRSLNNSRKLWQPSETSRLCSKHFVPDDIDPTSPFKIRLKGDAIPSIFPTHSKKEVPKRREIIRHVPVAPCVDEVQRESSLEELLKKKDDELEEMRKYYDNQLKLKEEELKLKNLLLNQIMNEIKLQNEELKELRKLPQKMIIKNKQIKSLNNSISYMKRKLTTMNNSLEELPSRNSILEERWTAAESSAALQIIEEVEIVPKDLLEKEKKSRKSLENGKQFRTEDESDTDTD